MILFAGIFVAAAQADTIVPDFVKAELPPNSTGVQLPFFMDPTNDIVFLKFAIPDFARFTAINSFVITINVFDDGDGGGEVGEFAFAQPSTNLFLGGFTSLNHITAGSPAAFV